MSRKITKDISSIIWKYGNRYSRSIRRIPLIRDIAERYYWKSFGIETRTSSAASPTHRDMIYLGDHRALLRTVFGHKMFVDTRDISIVPHLCLEGHWEAHITKVFMETLQKGMSVLEVGANIGYYTVLAASSIGDNGKIYSFEANPAVFKILHDNINLNGLLERAVLINKAVSDKSGKVRFHALNRYWGSSRLAGFSQEFLNKYLDEVKVIEVEALSLDEYFGAGNVVVDVIKVDAEGSEPRIFKGMRKLLSRNPGVKVICEFAPSLILEAGENPAQFLIDIKDLGFRLKVIDAASQLRDTSADELLAMTESNICELFLER